MSHLDAVMWRPNVFFGLWFWSLAVVFSGCGAALMTADQIVGPLATVAAAIFTSIALLVGAVLAWRSVQARFDLEEGNDRRIAGQKRQSGWKTARHSDCLFSRLYSRFRAGLG
jgi:hypothetical protein